MAQGGVWTGEQALQRGLVDQLGGLADAVADAAKSAKLGNDYAVRYVEQPTPAFQRFFLGLSDSASVRMLSALGLQVPKSWLAAVPRLAPELQLLEHAQPGKPITYAYCFCRIR